MTRRRRAAASPPFTVAERFAVAEAWNERAALVSTLAFQLPDLFAPQYEGGEPTFLIRRIGGGSSPANPAVVNELRAELFRTADRAREEAARILAADTAASSSGEATGLCGAALTPSVDLSAIKTPHAGDDIVPNPHASGPRELAPDRHLEDVYAAMDGVAVHEAAASLDQPTGSGSRTVGPTSSPRSRRRSA